MNIINFMNDFIGSVEITFLRAIEFLYENFYANCARISVELIYSNGSCFYIFNNAVKLNVSNQSYIPVIYKL